LYRSATLRLARQTRSSMASSDRSVSHPNVKETETHLYAMQYTGIFY
jgi:hypothetical protein